MDGLEVLTRLKTIAPGVPVIVVTISTATDVIVAAMKRGACEYVTKPYQDETLLAKIREALGERPRRNGAAGPGLRAPDPTGVWAWDGRVGAARRRCLIMVAQPGMAGTMSVALSRYVETEVALDGIRAVRLLGVPLHCVVCDDAAWNEHGAAYLRVVRGRCPETRVILVSAEPGGLSGAARAALVDDLVHPDEGAARIVRRALAGCLDRSTADVPRLGPHVGAAMDHLRRHYADDVSIRDVARAGGVSRGHLTQAFRAELGMSPTQYLTRLRVEVAKLLLQGRRAKLDEIAALSGFGDPSHLSRVFRAHTGYRPGAYRRHRA
jgi:AraC-like DNA-binding protein